jgi:MFS family permease
LLSPQYYRWYVVGVLSLAYVFSFVDRMIMSLMVEPIRADLGITDTQVSLLIGLAFALFYTLFGIPVALIADRSRRRTLIAIGITIWCFMTAACGLARNFWQLFAARMGVGVGEATLSPAATSLIGDYFPRHLLGRAVAVYTMGISIGSGIALIMGGKIVAYVTEMGGITLPIIGELKAWQAAFMLVGLPGLVVAALMFTVKEPERRQRLQTKPVPMMDGFRFIWQHRKTYGAHFFGLSVTTIMAYGYLSWVPTLFIRAYDWPIERIGLAYGSVMAVFGVLGVFIGGGLSDRLYARGVKDAHWKVMIGGVAFLIPAYIFVSLTSSPIWSLVLLAPAIVGGSIPAAAGPAALIIITPNEMRALVSSLYYFVINLIGLTVGPTAIALLTDYYFKDTAALPYSLAIVAAVAWIFSLLILLWGLKHYRRSVAQAAEWQET